MISGWPVEGIGLRQRKAKPPGVAGYLPELRNELEAVVPDLPLVGLKSARRAFVSPSA